MIRINLAPTKKRKKGARTAAAPASATAGQLVVMAMVLGWAALGGAGWWLIMLEEDETDRLRAEAARKNSETEEIRKTIDEEAIEARKAELEQTRVAIEKLEAQKQTPVFVMYELANILTTGKGPDVDEEEQRRNEAADPQSRLTPNWDATGVWINLFKQNGDALALEGGARDAADLAEFTRRLRASSWFGHVSHPDYIKHCNERQSTCYVTWRMNVQVQRWD